MMPVKYCLHDTELMLQMVPWSCMVDELVMTHIGSAYIITEQTLLAEVGYLWSWLNFQSLKCKRLEK